MKHRARTAAGTASVGQRGGNRSPTLKPRQKPVADGDLSEFSTSRSDRRPTLVRRRVGGKVVKGKLVGGAVVPVKASGESTRSKRVKVTVGGFSAALMRGALDQRSAVGRRYAEHKRALLAHLANDPTEPQAMLIEQAARLHLISDVVWVQLHRVGVFDKHGALTSGFDAYLRAARELRSVLDALGLERRQKQLPSLGEYIATKGAPGERDSTK